MAKHTIRGSHESYTIDDSGDTWIFTKGSTVISSNDAVTATGIANTRIVVAGLISAATGYVGFETSGTNVDISVAEGGRILSFGYGIYARAVGSEITIGGRVEGGAGYTALLNDAASVEINIEKGGKVAGMGTALASSGDNIRVDNHGTIAAGDGTALSVFGYGAEVDNSGRITSGSSGLAVGSSGDDAYIVNEKSGTITGGFQVQTEAGGSSRTINHGNIRSDSWVFLSYSGDDTLKNDGKMTGNISLGSGNDVVDMRGGTLDGIVRGDVGDDVLITDNAKYALEESDGGGEDTIKSSVSYRLDPTYYVERLALIGNKNVDATGTSQSERLTGNSGNNNLNGKGGYDYFDGKGGDDLLKSGTDGVENRFFFRTGYDHDTIQHLDHGIDTVYLGDWKAIDDFGDLLSHARNNGDDVVISAGNDSLTIMDMHKADLDAGDFTFLA